MSGELVTVPRKEWEALQAQVAQLLKRTAEAVHEQEPQGPEPFPGYVRFREKSRAFARRRRGE